MGGHDFVILHQCVSKQKMCKANWIEEVIPLAMANPRVYFQFPADRLMHSIEYCVINGAMFGCRAVNWTIVLANVY